MANQELVPEQPDQETHEVVMKEGTQQFLTFRLQEEMFGLDIRPIKEIIEYGKITNVPLAPSFVRGVINLRGNVVPVVDLPQRFGWEPSPVTKRTCIVVIGVKHDEDEVVFGIVIDSVSEVLDLPDSDLVPPPSFGAKIRTDFIAGMGKVNEEFIVLLSAAKVLSVDELSIMDSVAGSL